MTEVNFKEGDVKPKIVKKSNKPIAINSPVKQQHRIIETDENNNYNFQGEIPNELTGGLKNIIIYGLSYPCKNKKKLAYNLHQSKYTNKYLDKYMIGRLVDWKGPGRTTWSSGIKHARSLPYSVPRE